MPDASVSVVPLVTCTVHQPTTAFHVVLAYISNISLFMRVLCVAEKPSIARSISQILSGGRVETVSRK